MGVGKSFFGFIVDVLVHDFHPNKFPEKRAISSRGSLYNSYVEHSPTGEGIFTQVVGSTISNYALVMTVPSWANERKLDVPINRSIWITLRQLVIAKGTRIINFFGKWLNIAAT